MLSSLAATNYGLELHPLGCRPLVSGPVTGVCLDSKLDLTGLSLSDKQIIPLVAWSADLYKLNQTLVDEVAGNAETIIRSLYDTSAKLHNYVSDGLYMT